MIAWAIETTIVVAALAVVILLVSRILRPRPAVCHLLWTLALVKLLTPSFTTDWWPPQGLRDVVNGHAQNVAQIVHAESTALGRSAPTNPRAVIEKKLAYEPQTIEARWDAFREEVASIAYTEPKEEAASKETQTAMSASPEPATEAPREEEEPIAYSAIPDQRAAASGGGLFGWSMASLMRFVFFAIWIGGALWMSMIQMRRVLMLASRGRGAASEPPAWLRERVASIAGALGVAPPRLRIDENLSGPLVFALARPCILWPSESLDPKNRSAIDGIIAHELAHLKRRDHWIAWLELIAMCVWWWNPMQYVVRANLRHHAELAADAWAVSLQPHRRRDYAEALIEASSKQVHHAGYAAPALGVASSGRRAFERRLSMIMNKRLSCRVSPLVIIGTMALGVGVLPSWSLAKSLVTAPFSEGDQVAPLIRRAIEIHHLNDDLQDAVADQNWQAVAEIAATLANVDENDGNARHWLGYSLITLGETSKARAAFTEQAKLGHQPAKAAYNIACTYAREADGDAAMRYLNKAVAAGFHDLEMFENDTDLDPLRERADFGALTASIEESQKTRELADAAYEDELWADAAELYGQLCEKHPYVGPLHHRYGYTSIAAGQLESALKAFEREVELDPKNDTAMYNIACSYARMENVEPALRSLAAAIEHGFSNLELIENDTDLDNLRDSQGFEEIVASLRDRIETHSIAKQAFEEGDWSGAAEAWAAVIEMQPEYSASYHHLGFALHQLGEYDEAIAAFRKEAELGDALPRALYNIACGYSMKNNADASLEHLEAAVECGFDQTELMLTDSDLANIRGSERYLACVRRAGDAGVLANFGVRNWEEGYEKFSAAVAEEPENGRAWHALGFAALRVGKHDEAMKAFQMQKEHGFAVPNATYNMACVLAADGDADAALEALERSFKDGFTQISFARIDPDLAPLWNEPRFADLINEYADQNVDLEHKSGSETKETEEKKDNEENQ